MLKAQEARLKAQETHLTELRATQAKQAEDLENSLRLSRGHETELTRLSDRTKNLEDNVGKSVTAATETAAEIESLKWKLASHEQETARKIRALEQQDIDLRLLVADRGRAPPNPRRPGSDQDEEENDEEEVGRAARQQPELAQRALAPPPLPQQSYIRLMLPHPAPGARPHPRLVGVINQDLDYITQEQLPATVMQSAVDWMSHADNKMLTWHLLAKLSESCVALRTSNNRCNRSNLDADRVSCKTCTNTRRVCIRWMEELDAFALLRLDSRVSIGDWGNESFWILAGRRRAIWERPN